MTKSSKFRTILSAFSVGAFVLLTMPGVGRAAVAATVEQVQGEVFTQAAGSAPDAWQAVTQSTPLNSGDTLKTKNGTCVIAYADQATFALEPNTTITVTEKPDSQDLALLFGNLKAKVDSKKVSKPFQIVTPTAVAAVRGTEVNFGFNKAGQLTIDLNNGGPILVYNDEAAMELNLSESCGISVAYDKGAGSLSVSNNTCSGDVQFTIQGEVYTVKPGETVTANVEPETAAADDGVPGTQGDVDPQGETTPDEQPDTTGPAAAPPPPISPS